MLTAAARFIHYYSKEDSAHAVRELNGRKLLGRVVKVFPYVSLYLAVLRITLIAIRLRTGRRGWRLDHVMQDPVRLGVAILKKKPLATANMFAMTASIG